MENTPKKKTPGAGRSSFSLIDPERFFGQLRLKKGSTFLDMASGRGEYAIVASQVIGDEGLVYAIDLWEEGIVTLEKQASAGGIKNLKPILGDISQRIPIESNSVDVCLMATVMHELVLTESADGALKEASRVLNSHGVLAIIEFNKVERPPGPPIHIRLTPEDVERIVTPHGFRKERVIDVGPHNYLIMFDLCAIM